MSDVYPVDVDTLGNLKPLNQVVFSIGSNMGDRLEMLQAAVDRIAETPNVILVDVSPVYETQAVGALDQPDFLNCVVIADSILEPLTLLERCQAIELAYGRTRDIPHGPRTLDIDLIEVGKRTSNTETLVLPHPRAHERAFVLIPWLDIEPRAALPEGKVAELITKLDTSGVRPFDGELTRP